MPRITFLDDDHVMKMMRFLLQPANTENDQWLEAFFAAERVSIDELRMLGEGLRESDGIEIVLAKPEQSVGLDDTSVIVFRRGNVTRALIERCPSLRLIQRLGKGSDMIDTAAAQLRNVAVSCLERRSLAYTAEHALLLMLALSKKLVVADQAVRAGRFDAAAVHPVDKVAFNWVGLPDLAGLYGKTLGIIGFGEVGSLVAERARAFGMRIIYTNLVPLPPEREAALGVAYRSLDALLAESDIVSLHIPGGRENEKMLGRKAFSLMRRDAFFINISRGPLVDEDALYDALREGRIAGAALDVHAEEPRPAKDRFCSLDNVVLTPHIAGGSRRGVLLEISAIFDNMREALAGRHPAHGRIA